MRYQPSSLATCISAGVGSRQTRMRKVGEMDIIENRKWKAEKNSTFHKYTPGSHLCCYCFVPHSAQNLAVASILTPQFLQNISVAKGLPHSGQNFPPLIFAPQCGQAVIMV